MDDLQRELARLETTLSRADTPGTQVIDELSNMRRELARGTDRPARFQLPRVRIASPCKERWADMTGDDRVRVCNGCERPVFNLSEMTRDEAEAVLATRGIKPCVRFYRRADGTVKTADCPSGAPPRRSLSVVAGTVAAGAALLGSSAAAADPATPDATEVADPATPAPAPSDPAPSTEPDPHAVVEEPLMGEIYIPPHHEHTAIEWSTWVRVGYGMASHAPAVAVRAITQPIPVASSIVEAAVAADASVSLAHSGNLRLGAWGELRTSSGPVLGGELIVEGLPPHPYSYDFSGGGGVVIRAGGNSHVLTTAIGFGYIGSWSRSDPWIPFASHAVGVRFVASMNRSLDEPRDWSATFGVELEPLGALRYLVRRISDD